MKKIISFSLYGNKPNFQVGAVVNVIEAKRIYPDWRCRFYTTDDEDICKQLEYLGAEVVRMDDWPEGGMFWRFLAVDDADICISRDADSVVNEREVGAVKEWLEQDYQWHGMHDHRFHRKVSMMGGMWGYRHYEETNRPEERAQESAYFFDFRSKSMRAYINEWLDENKGRTTVGRGWDQLFLGDAIYQGKAQTNIMWHGAWVNNPGRPFPVHEPLRYGSFVGDYAFPRKDIDRPRKSFISSLDDTFDNDKLRQSCLESSRKLQEYDGPRRLVDRVILCWDGNPGYKDFWENLSPIYKDIFNIHPTLFFMGSEEQMKKCNLVEGATDRHDIFRLKNVTEVNREMFNDGLYWGRATFPRNWSTTWAIFYGASLFPEDVCATSGLDSVLLSDRFFDFIRDDMQPKEDDWVKDKMVIPLGDAYDNGRFSNTFPTSHVTAKGRIFKQLCQIDDDWETEIKKVFWSRGLINFTRDQKWFTLGRDCWGLDEQYRSVFVRNDKIFGCQPQNGRPKSDLTIVKEGFFSYWHPRRLCRGRNSGGGLKGKIHRYETKKCQDGYYIEIHGDRPFHKNEFFKNVIIDFMKSPKIESYFNSNRLYIHE